jgi:hypothetical protein
LANPTHERDNPAAILVGDNRLQDCIKRAGHRQDAHSHEDGDGIENPNAWKVASAGQEGRKRHCASTKCLANHHQMPARIGVDDRTDDRAKEDVDEMSDNEDASHRGYVVRGDKRGPSKADDIDSTGEPIGGDRHVVQSNHSRETKSTMF